MKTKKYRISDCWQIKKTFIQDKWKYFCSKPSLNHIYIRLFCCFLNLFGILNNFITSRTICYPNPDVDALSTLPRTSQRFASSGIIEKKITKIQTRDNTSHFNRFAKQRWYTPRSQSLYIPIGKGSIINIYKKIKNSMQYRTNLTTTLQYNLINDCNNTGN